MQHTTGGTAYDENSFACFTSIVFDNQAIGFLTRPTGQAFNR
jgi:hypothetical protein